MSSSPQDSGNDSGTTPASQNPPGMPPAPPAPPSTSPPAATSESPRRSSGRLGEWAALISAVAAVAGVALGFLGLPALVKSPTARTETVYVTVTPTPTPTPTVAATTPSSSASPSTSSTPSPPATTPPPAAGGGVTITLPEYYGFRLRGNVPVPLVEDWEEEGLDFARGREVFEARGNSRIVVLKPEEPGTLATCRSVTRFVENIDLISMEAGMRFCFESGKGGLALVETPKNGDPDDFLELTIQFLGNR
ncbi:hypothetical protein AB0E83_09505 [Streptomyces sp. NPDC035033]|uniref:hypothetical protein n=1 Tax=Streptomyces sp. NPDC035033 TaxID=3155368 RepID=UPI0033E6EFEF